ncbi:MAG: substrate-binding domain-containing protein [Flavobacterium sp.]|nr:substrate-binding domain-containing protein [Flavobacterium sp.]
MKNKIKYFFLIPIFIALIIFSCEKKNFNTAGNDSIIEGKITILVDETLTPIIEDQVQVFENKYKAKITIVPQSEKEAILSLAQDKAKVIVLPRKLTPEENKIFKKKNIVPRATLFGTDAIAFVKSKTADTLISLTDVLDFMKGKQNGIKGLVFDNPNSSTVSYLNQMAGLKAIPEKGIFSFKTNDEVIEYVSKNDGMIGVIGMNWISQPSLKMQNTVKTISVLSVKNSKNEYIYPSQDNIASKKYPLARDLYIINCQGYEGLGMGFSSFITGEIGQRIILKSGLVPFRVPGRNIIIKNNSTKKSN